MKHLIFFLSIALLAACAPNEEIKEEETWTPLFNGKDLTGWTPKFAGYPLGENYKNVFQAKDSVLSANYSEVDTFRNEFGHLFYQSPFRFYRLRLEYRFTGEPTPGAPDWAVRNNGVMIMCQDPKSMTLTQSFPLSLEVQMLGGISEEKRSTGNLCTPGTHVVLNGSLATAHCINSMSDTFAGDQWVELEVAVLPDSTIHHIIEGDTVLTYSKPVLGGDFLPEGYPLTEGTHIIEGYIALQAESHTTEFRNIRIQEILSDEEKQ